MTLFDSILNIACSVTRCSPRQALSMDKQRKCVLARYIFFALATENGSRDYVAVWHLHRDRSLSYHYKNQVKNLSMNDNEFNSLLTKARKKYAELDKPI